MTSALIRVSLALVALFGSVAASCAMDYTFNPDGSTESPRNWANWANWTPQGVPGYGDNVTIPAVSGTTVGLLPHYVKVANLTMNGDVVAGHVDLQGALMVTNNFNWLGGSISGKVRIPAGATLTISGSNDKAMNGGFVFNYGIATWSGRGRILGGNSSIFYNFGQFISTSDNSFGYSTGSKIATFCNRGIFTKSGGTGVTYIGDFWAYQADDTVFVIGDPWAYQVQGAINAQTGTVQFGEVSGQEHELIGGAQISGTGAVVVTDALHVQGPVTLADGANLELAAGSVLSSDGNEYPPGYLYESYASFFPTIAGINYNSDNTAAISGSRDYNGDYYSGGGSSGSGFTMGGINFGTNSSPVGSADSTGTTSLVADPQSALLRKQAATAPLPLTDGISTPSLTYPGDTQTAQPSLFPFYFARFVGPGTLIWSGGSISAGSYSKGIVETGTDTHLAILGADTKELDRHTVFNHRGAAFWTGTGSVIINGGTFNNMGTFDVENNAILKSGSAGYFNNFGDFTKSSPGATIFKNVFLTNSGTMTISRPIGSLAVRGNSFAQYSTGVLNLAATTVQLTDDWSFISC